MKSRIVWLASMGVAGAVAGCGIGPHRQAPASAPLTPAASSAQTPAPETRTPRRTWQVTGDFVNPDTGWVAAQAFTAPGHIAEDGIFRTDNGGRSWRTIVSWDQAHPLPDAHHAGGPMAIGPMTFQNTKDGEAEIFLGAGACQAGYAVMKTTDGGSHGSLITASPIIASDGPTGLSFPGGPTGVGYFANGSCAGSYTLLYKKAADHTAWNRLPSVPSPQVSPRGLSLSFSSPQDGVLVTATNGVSASHVAMQTTQNGGVTWTSRPITSRGLPAMVSQLSFASPHQGWALAYQAHQSVGLDTLSGEVWTRLGIPQTIGGSLPSIDRVTARTGYLAENGRRGIALWKTLDNGLAGMPLTLPNPQP